MDKPGICNFNTAPYSAIHRKIAAGALLGIFSDGYTLRIVGVYLANVQQSLNLSSSWLGLIGAGSMFGMFFGSLVGGLITDRTGRKTPYCASMLLAAIVSVLQFWLATPSSLLLARFLLGIIIGLDYAAGITLLSEWSPDKNREKLTGSLIVFWMLGYCLAYATGYIGDYIANPENEKAWRILLCSSAAPCLLAFLFRLGAPESPLWLAAKNRNSEALAIIHKHLGTSCALPERAARTKAAHSWRGLIAKDQWRKTVVSCVFYLAQVVPFFAISIFLPLVLSQMRLENQDASGAIYNLLTLLGAFAGFWLYTTLSRRTFLLWTFYVSASILAVLSIWTTMPPLAAVLLVGAFAFVMAIALIPEFSYPAELFPTELRASGVGLTVAISNIGAGAGTFLLPVMSQKFGVHSTLFFSVCILLLGGIICQMWAPPSPRHAKKRGEIHS